MAQSQSPSDVVEAQCDDCNQTVDHQLYHNGDDWICGNCGASRHVLLVDNNRGNERSFPTVEIAEEKKSDLRAMGASPEDLEIRIPDENAANGDGSAELETDEKRGESKTEKTDGGSKKNGETPEFEDRDEPAEEPKEVIAEPVENGTVDIESEEQFISEIKGVPDEFVIDMGGSPHIRKQGYYYLAAEMGLEFGTEPLNPTWEGDPEMSAFRGVVRDGDKTWSNVGTAHLDNEDMAEAEANLDELAATRAACRALSMATGTGVNSMEEMIGVDSDAQD